MFRRRFAIWAALSFVLCIAMMAIWSRSNERDFWLQGSIAKSTYALKMRGGLISFYRVHPGGGYLRPPTTLAELPVYYPILIAAFCTYLLLVYSYRRAGSPGRCKFCGYDLRATPLRCPECGHGASD